VLFPRDGTILGLRIARSGTTFLVALVGTGGASMFESLDDQMKLDDKKEVSSTERMFRWGLYILVSVLVFGGIVLAVHKIG
jgi:glycerol uptake facilitator-like aquaporin